jgi:hypothetical protein
VCKSQSRPVTPQRLFTGTLSDLDLKGFFAAAVRLRLQNVLGSVDRMQCFRSTQHRLRYFHTDYRFAVPACIPVDSRKRRASSVSAYLLFVAISCTVPVAVFGGYFAYHFASEASAHAKSDLEQRLSLMRNAVDQRVDSRNFRSSPARPIFSQAISRFETHAVEVTKLVGAITILLSDRQATNC